jgi:hypothetical protein
MNKMTTLLNKIERRLGTLPLNLPEKIRKDKWANVIKEDTLDTFSRYFPNKFTIHLDCAQVKNGYYIIDENICESLEILGVKDLNWDSFSNNGIDNSGYGIYDFSRDSYSMEDVAFVQMMADHRSLFDNNIYLEWKEPNMIRLVSVTGSPISTSLGVYPVDLLIKHSDNLMTISPTMMETFEELAKADVAVFLYEYLKHFDGIETVFANTDLKLGDIQNKAERRDEAVQSLKDSYVSASNQNQPLMITI